jgi:hypothetical protein
MPSEHDQLVARIEAAAAPDAWNAPPAERLAAIAQLFAIGEDAIPGEHIAVAGTCAYLAGERLKAHKFMLLNVEGGRGAAA